MQDNVEILHDRYARALYEHAKDTGEVDKVMRQLQALNDLWLSNSNFRVCLRHPLIARWEKKQVMKQLAKIKDCCETLLNFVNILIENKRGGLIHGVFLKFKDLYELYENRASVVLESARELSNEEKQRMKQALSEALKKNVSLKTRVNKDLISGVRIRHGDTVFSNSLISKLNRLREGIV